MKTIWETDLLTFSALEGFPDKRKPVSTA